uniref:Vif n=1 Tax=Simian immunodeficiency virus TaxID=11723 RepID=A0A075E6U8_SIV|nr:Vif [Simian immunodeficiency virus]
MAPRKMWVVSPIQVTTERHLDWLIRCTKYHILSGQTPWSYVHAYQLQHQRFSQNKIRIPLTQETTEREKVSTHIEITILWDVTNVGPASLSKSTYYEQSYILEWVYKRNRKGGRETDTVWYHTHLTVGLAMRMIHYKYFSCFQEEDIRRAIRGEQLLGHCQHQQAHFSKVGTPLTLEKLAFLAYIKHYGKSTPLTYSPMALQACSHNHATGSGGHVGGKRRGRKTLLKRRAPWNLERRNGATR